jgi:hypothetical protein
MNVYTYFEPYLSLRHRLTTWVTGGRRNWRSENEQLLRLWEASWRRKGWNPVVLDRKVAQESIRYRNFLKAISRLPSANDKAYEQACFLRHLAMSVVGGGVLSDYDCMNQSFTPEQAGAFLKDEVRFLEPYRVPCLIIGTKSGYEKVCDVFEEYRLTKEDRVRGRPHVSDMTILQKTKWPIVPVCVEYLHDGVNGNWENAPVVHFATEALRKKYKSGSKFFRIANVLREACS